MAPRNHAACVGSYCDAILSGEIIAGGYVELAVSSLESRLLRIEVELGNG